MAEHVIHSRLLFWASGFAPFPWLIVIHPSRRGDLALIEHEKTHCEQMRRYGVLWFWWHYAFSKSFRQAAEVDAYKAQIAAGASLEACARNLVTMYRLGIDLPKARELLS